MDIIEKSIAFAAKYLKTDEPLIDRDEIAQMKYMQESESFYSAPGIRFLMLGHFKAGKSSLINCLAGQDIAAVDALEKTAWVARYWPSDTDFCIIHKTDGSKNNTSISRFLEDTENDRFSTEELQAIYRIDVGYTGGKNDWVLIDSPGIGSVNKNNENLALSAVNDADMVLFVLDINKIGNLRDTAIIENIKKSGVPMICVANKYDGDIEEDLSEDEAIDMVARYVPFEKEDIFLFSGKEFLKHPKQEKARYDRLVDRLKEASIHDLDIRVQAKEASEKRLATDVNLTMLELQGKLLGLKLNRTELERSYVHSQKVVEAEMSNYLNSFISSTLYKEYRSQIASAIEEKSPRSDAEFSAVIKDIVPDSYIDSYWKNLTGEASRKFRELWQDQIKDVSELQKQLQNELTIKGVDVKLNIEHLLQGSRKAQIVDAEVAKSFDWGNFALCFGLALFNPALGILGMIGVGLASLIDGASTQNSKITKINGEMLLHKSINDFAEKATASILKTLAVNEKAIMDFLLQEIDKGFVKLLPANETLDAESSSCASCISSLETSFSGLRSNDEIDRLHIANDILYEKISKDEKKREEEGKVKTGLEQRKIDDPIEELDGLIGLSTVKQEVHSLLKQLEVDKKKKDAGLPTPKINLNYVFTGNPGTGKTTVARLMAKAFKKMGYLEKGQLIEADRNKLVSMYVGATAIQTTKVIEEAYGGVLFIDEAYTLYQGSDDSYGQESCDTLLRLMDDHRDELVVIVAGYTDKIRNFLNSNEGFRSRFTKYIDFPDYSSDELTQIFAGMCASNQLNPTADCMDAVRMHYDSVLKHKAQGFGNGRDVRNFFEHALQQQTERLARDGKTLRADLAELMREDVIDIQSDIDVTNSTAIKELDQMIGLDPVKEAVRDLVKRTNENLQRQRQGLQTAESTMHMVFTGNPGTGKTTVARIIGKIYSELGLLSKGQFIEADKDSLVSEYSGGTVKKTTELLESAYGGVLFIDEAYTLANDKSGGGKEAVDTLLKLMEDHRDDLVVIVAGYQKEMNEFIGMNPGLRSRFKNFIFFPDYNADELTEIFKKTCKDNDYIPTVECIKKARECFAAMYNHRSACFANGREVRNFFENAVNRQSKRLSAIGNKTDADMMTLIPEDLFDSQPEITEMGSSALTELDSLIGLESVKKEIRTIINITKNNLDRQRQGLKASETTMHMVFTGNPGTGKTTVARLIGRVYKELGILTKGQFVEADRSMLVGQYVGETAIKTEKLVESALGGVLFIDEAYSLASGSGSSNDYGKEAVDTLLKMMEDHRDNLVVIAAGYQNEMNDFINMNPGLKSRFKNFIDFPDYNGSEMTTIFLKLCKDHDYVLTEDCIAAVQEHFEDLYQHRTAGFANGREVRNYFETVTANQANRLALLDSVSREEQMQLLEQDL